MSLSYEQPLQREADIQKSTAERIAIEPLLITTGVIVPSGQVVYARK